MNASLVSANTPAAFWRLTVEPPPGPAEWSACIQAAADLLPQAARASGTDIASLLSQTLGEGQFGPRHWRLTFAKRLYYTLKPLLPRALTRVMRRLYQGSVPASFPLEWPVEARYASFQWRVIRYLLQTRDRQAFSFISFWPHAHQYAFAITHDVETADGQARVRAMADLDASFGFRSAFNFVAEDYPLDWSLLDHLRTTGFEIGLHGDKHDGRLFRSPATFRRRAARINHHLTQLGAVGFRSPLTHRNPEWMQGLQIEYDSSFFDTDPYEPIPGGTMSLWPFQLGHFIELPYTLAQDYTLTAVLGETTPRVWLEKVDFIERCSGLALVNAHPDYLRNPVTRRLYTDFLQAMSRRSGYWHALPKDVARWWRSRMRAASPESLAEAVISQIA